MPRPAGKVTGPIWSRKMKGPTMRRCGAGSTRRTEKPPRSRSRGTTTSATAGQEGTSVVSGGAAGCQLIALPSALGAPRPHRPDRRQARLRHTPGIAAILGDPEAAARRAEGEALAAAIDIEGVAPDEVIGVVLRQAVAQHLEAAAAVARARDDDLAVHRNAALVLHRRDEPGRLGVARMGGDGEAEFRGPDRRHLAPIGAAILRAEDAVVMLTPEDVGMGGAAGEAMDVLGDRLLAQLRRHVFGTHAAVDDAPGGAAIAARPDARRRDADPDVVGGARIDEDRVDAGLLAAGDAEPFPPLRHAPQRLDEGPALAAVIGAEEPARHGAGPEPARNAALLERPDLAQGPGMRIVRRVRGLRREGRGRELAPVPAGFAAPELGAEMAEIERRMERALRRQHRRHRLAEEMHGVDFPPAAAARQLEEPLARPDMKPIGHPPSPLRLIRRSAPEGHRSGRAVRQGP